MKQINSTISQPEPEKTGDGTDEPDMNRLYHDFRSSLNIIIGYTELMIDGAMGKMTDEQREGMKDVLTSSFHLLDLLDKASGHQPTVR